MDVTFHKLYLYDHVWQLLAVGDSFCPYKDNGPMNNNISMKAHKGLDNKLIFRVLGPDRSPQDIASNQQVYARIIDPDNRKVEIEKLCRLGPAKGIITLELDSGDLALIHAGLHEIVLIRTEDFVANIPGYYVEKPLYSNMNDDVAMQIEITEQAFKTPSPSITIFREHWSQDVIPSLSKSPAPCLYTSRIPGGRVRNHINSVHTFSTYTENATGVLEIFGSLESTPDPYLQSTHWTKIYPSSMSRDIRYKGYTGTQAWTFAANFMWIKFRWTPSTEVLDAGKMTKLIVRT
jgi:hypothetical protein